MGKCIDNLANVIDFWNNTKNAGYKYWFKLGSNIFFYILVFE